MKSTPGWTALWMGFIALSCASVLAQERWVYRYNGPRGYSDEALSIAAGIDGNLYAAGYSSGGSATHDDLAVISLTPSGEERWVYSYDGPGHSYDNAKSISSGADGHVYATGTSWGSSTNYDLIVVSLDVSGTERWVYRYNGPGAAQDLGNSIVVGAKDNVYICGQSWLSGPSSGFIVVSLSPSGGERWVYRCNGTSGEDEARWIAVAPDDNLYAAGTVHGSGTESDFTVVSLTPLGAERWVYIYDGPVNLYDYAEAIAMGRDGNVYAAGTSHAGTGHSFDFMVISLTPKGEERWIYRYNGSGNGMDAAFAIVTGTDGNIYAAGYSSESGTPYCFTVISLTPSGQERWVYTRDGSGYSWDCAHSLAVGGDGNVYATGVIDDSVTVNDIIVVSLTPSGEERWVYRYDGSDNAYDWDVGYSIVAGIDGNLYAAGYSCGAETYEDFTVIGLSPDVGVEEKLEAGSKMPECRLRLSASPVPTAGRVTIHFYVPAVAGIGLSVYDACGRLVTTLVKCTEQVTPRAVVWDGRNDSGDEVSTGIYYCRLTAGDLVATKKMVVLR